MNVDITSTFDPSVLKSCAAGEIAEFAAYRIKLGMWDRNTDYLLRAFDRMCTSKFPDGHGLSQDMIQAWCCKREGEKLNSLSSRMAPIVAMAAYFSARGRTDLTVLKQPNRTKSRNNPLSFDCLSRFFSLLSNLKSSEIYSGTSKPHRILRCVLPPFFALLYSSGMRICDARWLRKQDVDFNLGVIRIIKAKGGNQYFAPLSDDMIILLERYEAAIEQFFPNREIMFPNTRGEVIQSQMVNHIFRKLWNAVNPGVPAMPYDLRHNFAITNINSWLNDCGTGEFSQHLIALQHAMGHADLKSTLRYYDIVPWMSDLLEELSSAGYEMITRADDYEN